MTDSTEKKLALAQTPAVQREILLAALRTLTNVIAGGSFPHSSLCAMVLDDTEDRCSCDRGLLMREAVRARAVIARVESETL